MSYDIYGNPLRRGHCEVHPHVHQEYPCDLCLSQRSPKQRAPARPMCGICGGHEACADSCGVPVCSEACDREACDREARREHDGRDAARWRHWRLHAHEFGVMLPFAGPADMDSAIDAAIDAAIAAEGEK